jgi:lipopolysaccharide export system protein LptA
MASERMEVNYADAQQGDGSKKTEVTVINASGGVKITTGRQVITGRDAILDVKGNQLTVKGSVVVTEGSTVIHGETLKVDLKTKVSAMTGGRVKGSFIPSNAGK